MVQTLVALLVLGAVVGIVFMFVWRVDAKRAEDVESDEERLHTDEHLPADQHLPSEEELRREERRQG